MEDDEAEGLAALPARRAPRKSVRAGSQSRSSNGASQSMSSGSMAQTLPDGTTQSLGADGAANDASADGDGPTVRQRNPLLLARSAENLYWLARYLERAENTARLIATHGQLLMDLPGDSASSGWRSLVAISGDDELFATFHDVADEATVTDFMIAERKNPNSLVSVAGAIRANLRSVRDTLPTSLYESINELVRRTESDAASAANATRRQGYLHAVEQMLLAIAGTAEGSMSRDRGWLFLRIGCLVERADMTSRILDVRSGSLMQGGPELAEREWISVLRSLIAFRMYRLHVNRPVRGAHVLAYLLNDPDLPRAYRYCLDRIADCLRRLGAPEEPQAAMDALAARLDGADLAALAGDRAALHDFIDGLQIGLSEVSGAIGTRFFPPVPPLAEPDES